MPRKVSDERERYWRDLVMRQPTSGLNIARFCKDAGASAECLLHLEEAAANHGSASPRCSDDCGLSLPMLSRSSSALDALSTAL